MYKTVFTLPRCTSIFISLICVILQVLAIPLHTLESSPFDVEKSEEDIIEGISVDQLSGDLRFDDIPVHNLTEEEQILANEARKEIANVLESNLVRLFAVIASRGQKFGRQEDEAEEVEDVVTPNPNVLPQVAQILGAIFSNNLNLTSIVDRTFGLVPNVVRMQLMGIVKLLTGQDIGVTSTTPETEREFATSPSVVITSSPPTFRSNESSLDEVDSNTVTTIKPVAIKNVARVTTAKQRYRIKSRTTTEGTTDISSGTGTTAPILEDDELERYEKDLRATAKIYEPFVKDKQPKFFVRPFQDILTNVNFNSKEIVRAVPNIFKGAKRAFVLLESLGIVPELANNLSDDAQ